MYRSKDYVEWEMEQQKAMKSKWVKKLAALPRGRLSVSFASGRPYYYRVVDGKKIYVGNGSNRLVQQLKQRRVLETAVRNIDMNQNLMKQFLEEYREVSLPKLLSTLPKTYQPCNTDILNEEIPADLAQWAAAPYNKSGRNPEGLTIQTLKGDMVRSKSEALIANMLYEQGIPYHYEENLTLGDKVVAPDFTIAVAGEARFKFLEHCGMMESESYCQNFTWKLRTYLRHGYVPWRDVFFTFEHEGSIDTKAIRYLIDCYFV